MNEHPDDVDYFYHRVTDAIDKLEAAKRGGPNLWLPALIVAAALIFISSQHPEERYEWHAVGSGGYFVRVDRVSGTAEGGKVTADGFVTLAEGEAAKQAKEEAAKLLNDAPNPGAQEK